MLNYMQGGEPIKRYGNSSLIFDVKVLFDDNVPTTGEIKWRSALKTNLLGHLRDPLWGIHFSDVHSQNRGRQYPPIDLLQSIKHILIKLPVLDLWLVVGRIRDGHNIIVIEPPCLVVVFVHIVWFASPLVSSGTFWGSNVDLHCHNDA